MIGVREYFWWFPVMTFDGEISGKRAEYWQCIRTRLSYYYVAAIFFVYFHFFFFIAIVFVVLLLLLLISLLLIYFSYHFLLFLFSFFLCHLAFFEIFLLFYFDLFFGSTVSSEKIVSLLMYMQLYSFKYWSILSFEFRVTKIKELN